MCGIAGYLYAPGQRRPETDVERMCQRLAHRGPDDSGFYHDDCVSLGHRFATESDTEVIVHLYDHSRKIWTLWMFTTWAKHHGW